jgi:hypothetical protein
LIIDGLHKIEVFLHSTKNILIILYKLNLLKYAIFICQYAVFIFNFLEYFAMIL